MNNLNLDETVNQINYLFGDSVRVGLLGSYIFINMRQLRIKKVLIIPFYWKNHKINI